MNVVTLTLEPKWMPKHEEGNETSTERRCGKMFIFEEENISPSASLRWGHNGAFD